MYYKQKKCLDSSFLLLIFLHRGFFLLLIKQSFFKVLLKVSSECLVSGSSLVEGSFLIRKKGKLAKMAIPCQLFTFVVPIAVTTSTTQSHSLSLTVICCYSLSLDVSLICLFLQMICNVCKPIFYSLLVCRFQVDLIFHCHLHLSSERMIREIIIIKMDIYHIFIKYFS